MVDNQSNPAHWLLLCWGRMPHTQMADAKLQALFYCDQQLLSLMVQPPSANQTNLVVLMHDDRRVFDPEEHGALRRRVLHLVLELARVVGAVLF